uniref:ABSCISIC ACID-INSENSITIVE 5-like protein 3 n=1 Tax=Erigeron canadensis TaxID=72917 RepID=UPI001CB8D6A8|nr:ABSCISIC ACID-INSENSITIVE 5-like protein 3 [Erigeron canadensis]
MGTQTQKHMMDDGLMLSRQGSTTLYNLTLDEVQQQLGDLGKPFSSMNLDELLKTVNHPNDYTDLDSGITKKTVDEVWRSIQMGQKDIKNGGDGGGSVSDGTGSGFKNGGDGNRQGTLGEMTLEDFLVKAGVVADSSGEKKESEEMSVVDMQGGEWMNMNYPQMPMIEQQQSLVMGGHYPVQQQSAGLGAGSGVMDVGYMSRTPLMGSLSDAHMTGRKRSASGGVIEKSVERRQKRMIKNRESAARSRARKQAYTQELENKISRLEEENEKLRREKEVEKVLPCVPPPKPKIQLRRTTSASF